MSDQSNLSPCPFCGETPSIRDAPAMWGGDPVKIVTCDLAGCAGGVTWFTLAQWSARPIESAPRAEVEALRRENNALRNGIELSRLEARGE